MALSMLAAGCGDSGNCTGSNCTNGGTGGGGAGGGAGGDTAMPLGLMPQASDIQNKLFGVSCAFVGICHGGTPVKATLDFSSLASTCAALKMDSCEMPGVKRADMANPAASYLIKKLTCMTDSSGSSCTASLGMTASTCPNTVGGMNTRMPMGSLPQALSDIATIQTWIMMGMPGCP
jgi:hypothetical protein